MDTVKGWFGGNKDTVKGGIDKAGDVVDDKTGGKSRQGRQGSGRGQGRRRQAPRRRVVAAGLAAAPRPGSRRRRRRGRRPAHRSASRASPTAGRSGPASACRRARRSAPRLAVRVGGDVGHRHHRRDGGLGRLERGQHLVDAAAPRSRRPRAASSSSRCSTRPAKVVKRASSPTPEQRHDPRRRRSRPTCEMATHVPSAQR